MRKIIITILITTLVFSNLSFSFIEKYEAKEDCPFSQNEIENLISSYIEENELYNSKYLYYIGDRINVYDITFDKNTYQLEENVYKWLYPVYKENEIILTVLISGETCKISTDGVEGINRLYQKHKEPVFVCDSTHCYAFVDNTQTLIDEDHYSKTEFIAYKNYEIYSQIKELVSMKEGYKYNKSSLNIKQTEPTRSGTIISGFPIISQSPWNNGCWAACMACFIKKYAGGNPTASSVINTIGCGDVTRNPGQVISYLDNYYDIIVYSSIISASILRSNIDNNKAFIIGWTYEYTEPPISSPIRIGHMTCLYGYVPNGLGYKYYIMDPNGAGGNIANTYELITTSASALPKNSKIYTTKGVSTSIGYEYSITSAITYDYTR